MLKLINLRHSLPKNKILKYNLSNITDLYNEKEKAEENAYIKRIEKEQKEINERNNEKTKKNKNLNNNINSNNEKKK